MTKIVDLGKASLDYHSSGRPGKIEVISSKSCRTERDLSLAYSPGVAEPCKAIYKDPSAAYKYTSKGNLVAVISNGTAVLGLGNLGALASKPVMEGKGVLFKRFADIDVYDIELDTENADEFIRAVQLLEPTFGGINLEDIKAPECFYIEQKLRETMKIPVFHDDQHGTAIISGAAFLNAVLLVDKNIEDMKVVFSGGGAAAIACARLYKSLGVLPKNLLMCDSQGVIHDKRGDLNEFKKEFAIPSDRRTLEDAMKGADAFIGLSVKGAVTPKMVASMAKDPIVFAMANPDPEIGYDEACAVRKDIIMATGRSDFPNQVNNVLGFPFIFRGALDVRASTINEEMKIAAVQALAKLAQQEVPDIVSQAYGGQRFKFGREYIIPKPFDRRALLWVAPAVAKAAMDSGVAQERVNLDEYVARLEKRLGVRQSFVRSIKDSIERPSTKGGVQLPKIVFPEGGHPKILRACEIMMEEEICIPILLGNRERIVEAIEKQALANLRAAQIITPSRDARREAYANEFWHLRERKGISRDQAYSLMKNENYYGSMMVKMGHADGLLSGITQSYRDTIRPFLQVVGTRKGMKISGVYMMLFKERVIFFADTTVNIEPNASDLADIAICAAEEARFFNIEPKVAMLSFSNFGGHAHPFTEKVREAVRLVKLRRPDIIVDGEMQADTAVDPQIVEEIFPFCEIKGGANVLIFPDLQSANICYKLMQRLGGAEAIGPLLIGINKPINVLQRTADVDEIVNMAAITVLEIQKGGALIGAPSLGK
jgi:malate dehydrogenase (oxaloacetate-decarboxylating)(NADP+)